MSVKFLEHVKKIVITKLCPLMSLRQVICY